MFAPLNCLAHLVAHFGRSASFFKGPLIYYAFLDAFLYLYKSVCVFFRQSVCLSVRSSVGWSVRRSVRRSVTLLKTPFYRDAEDASSCPLFANSFAMQRPARFLVSLIMLCFATLVMLSYFLLLSELKKTLRPLT